MAINKNLLLIGLIGLSIGATAGYFFGYDIGYEKAVSKSINSFEECAKAGYPIMESYPAQCKTPDGRRFTESL